MSLYHSALVGCIMYLMLIWNFYFHFYSFYKLAKTVDSIIVHGKNMQKRLSFFNNKTEFFAPIVNSNNNFKLEISSKLNFLEKINVII